MQEATPPGSTYSAPSTGMAVLPPPLVLSPPQPYEDTADAGVYMCCVRMRVCAYAYACACACMCASTCWCCVDF